MTILSAIRDRFWKPRVLGRPIRRCPGGCPGRSSRRGLGSPFVGYDGLDAKQVVVGLSDHSQLGSGRWRPMSGRIRTDRPCWTSCATCARASRCRARRSQRRGDRDRARGRPTWSRSTRSAAMSASSPTARWSWRRWVAHHRRRATQPASAAPRSSRWVRPPPRALPPTTRRGAAPAMTDFPPLEGPPSWPTAGLNGVFPTRPAGLNHGRADHPANGLQYEHRLRAPPRPGSRAATRYAP